jgi:hypothetical protein
MMVEEQVTHQSTLHLPYFNEEVPVLHVTDGTSYVPVIKLCNMLGLPGKKHIPKWRKLFLWIHARKLLFQTATGRKQRVWCLHTGAIPLWCACFDWSLVSPERQEQLHQIIEASSETLGQAYQAMLSRYKQMRSFLFEFLTAYKDMETKLSRLAARLHLMLDYFDACIQLEELIAQGKAIIQQAVNHARQMIKDQTTNPVIDAVKITHDGQIIEELTLPLFPVFLEEDFTQFFDYLRQLVQWHQQFMAFLDAQGILLSHDQDQ